MKALCWYGTGDIRIDDVRDPKIEDPRDVIVGISGTFFSGLPFGSRSRR